MQSNDKIKTIIRNVMRIAPTPGVRKTIMPQIVIGRTEAHYARQPVLYNPRIIVVLQGHKRGFIGDRICDYDADNYFVSAIPMQFECETFGSKEIPLLSISINIDLPILREIVMQIEMKPHRQKAIEACYATPVTPDIMDAINRLIAIMADATEGSKPAEVDIKILGPSLLREIYYRALQGPHGGTLYALATRHNNLSDMNSVIDFIHQKYADELSVDDLARSSNMSATMFHQYFKELTATSPIQYVKALRLHKAKMFMVQDGLNASEASEKVGYNSLSQFSREFKRMFGSSPTEETAKARAIYGIDQAELLSIR